MEQLGTDHGFSQHAISHEYKEKTLPHRARLSLSHVLLQKNRGLSPVVLCLLLILVLNYPTAALSESSRERWSWYYAGFQTPALGSSIFLRYGVAEFKRAANGRTGSYELSDSGRTDLKSIIKVWPIRKNEVAAVLQGFFPEQDEYLIGSVRELKGLGNCNFQEIVFKRSEPKLKVIIPDGSVLVLSRTTGACQEKNRINGVTH